jgi:hypothetical protein
LRLPLFNLNGGLTNTMQSEATNPTRRAEWGLRVLQELCALSALHDLLDRIFVDELVAAFAVFETVHPGAFVQLGLAIGADQLTIGGGNDVLAGATGQNQCAAGDEYDFFHGIAPDGCAGSILACSITVTQFRCLMSAAATIAMDSNRKKL